MSQQVTRVYAVSKHSESECFIARDHQHWLTQKDVDMANSYVIELIERTRSSPPQSCRQAGICNRVRLLRETELKSFREQWTEGAIFKDWGAIAFHLKIRC